MKKKILKGKLIWMIPAITTIASFYYITLSLGMSLKMVADVCLADLTILFP